MLFIVFGGEQSAYVREHPPHASRGLVNWSMGLTVAVLAVLAVVGGWIQVFHGWTAVTTWLEPVARSLVEASTKQESDRQHLRGRARHARHRRRLVDLLGAQGEGAAAVAGARAQVLLRRAVQRPLLLARGRALQDPLLDDRGAGRRTARSSASPEPRAARAAGSASSRPASCACTCSRWPPGWPSSSSSSSRCADDLTRLADHDDDPAAADRGACDRGPAAAEGLGRADRAARLAVRDRLLDRGARPVRLRQGRPPGVEPRDLAEGSRRLVLRRLLPGLLGVAGRADRRRDGRCDRLRLLDGPRPAPRLLRDDAVPDRRDRRRVHLTGSAPLLRLLGGDADPAVRPDRGVGRPGPAERDDQVRHLHDGRLAADARGDHRLRAPGRDVLDGHRRDERQRLDLPRLRGGVRRQGAALPVPRLAAGRVPRVAGRRSRRCSRA